MEVVINEPVPKTLKKLCKIIRRYERTILYHYECSIREACLHDFIEIVSGIHNSMIIIVLTINNKLYQN